MKNKEKAVVVFSGGQDSTTCLLWALKNYKEVLAVSFDYGQRHKKELECGAAICEKLGVKQTVIDLKELNRLAPNSLTREDIKVDTDAPEEGTPNSFVEGRNMLFLTYAAIFAKGEGITDIITGGFSVHCNPLPELREHTKTETIAPLLFSPGSAIGAADKYFAKDFFMIGSPFPVGCVMRSGSFYSAASAMLLSWLRNTIPVHFRECLFAFLCRFRGLFLSRPHRAFSYP